MNIGYICISKIIQKSVNWSILVSTQQVYFSLQFLFTLLEGFYINLKIGQVE